MKRSRTMLATVAMLGAAVGVVGTGDSDKLKSPAALTEQAPATYKAEFDTSRASSSSTCTATGRRSAPIASTTS